jgi:hypothetical protein
MPARSLEDVKFHTPVRDVVRAHDNYGLHSLEPPTFIVLEHEKGPRMRR